MHHVAFSPDGNRLAWVSHDSTISVVDAERKMTVTVLKTRYLPFLTCIWPSNNLIIAAVSSGSLDEIVLLFLAEQDD